MDHFDQVLSAALKSSSYNSGIKSAIQIGKKTLNRYYSQTDASGIYRISMGKSLIMGFKIMTSMINVT